MSIRDRDHLGSSPFGIEPIWEHVHLGWCLLGNVEFRDGVHLGSCPFKIVTIRNCIRSGLFPFWVVSIPNCVQSVLSSFGIVFIRAIDRIYYATNFIDIYNAVLSIKQKCFFKTFFSELMHTRFAVPQFFGTPIWSK